MDVTASHDINRRPTCFSSKLQTVKSGFWGKSLSAKFGLSSSISDLSGESSSSDEKRSEGSKSSKSSCMDKPPISFWRTANCSDVKDIYELTRKSDHIVDNIFSPPDIPDLIEKSAFALVQFNSKKEMISFTSTFAYPNIFAVPSFEWFNWFERMYQINDLTPRNCLFIHYMIWRTDYCEEFLGLTLQTLFMEMPFLKYIILVKPPLVKIPDILGEYFVPSFPLEMKQHKWDSNSVQTLLLCLRHSVLDRLKIRLATVEDHDDLMPIIEQQTDKLRELYGDFCLAEIIEYPGTEERKTLVCEVMGYAVGFMNLNRAVDVELLNTQFDLGVFHGLRKPVEEDKNAQLLKDDREQIVYLPEKADPSLKIINSDIMDSISHWRPKLCESQSDEMFEKHSEESVDSNGLSPSVTKLMRDSFDAKLISKFSAFPLVPSGSNIAISNSDIGETRESIKTELSLISLQYYNLPEYHGPSNAFCIELFAVHKDFDEKLCLDFLEAAFELFPDLEYCLISIPSQTTPLPILDLFVRVTPRPLKRFKQELYVCHKNSVMITFMRVRRARKSDLNEIKLLIKGIKNEEFIYADLVNSCIFPDSAYQGFVLVCNTNIVGAAVLCNEDNMEYLTEHYRVAELIDFDLHKIDYHAMIKHFVLSPIYQTHARFFLGDIMRMADITALYRARYEDTEIGFSTGSLITALDQLVPVRPRRMIKYHLPSLESNLPPEHLMKNDFPFALYHINSRICTLRKFTSNINLVIVGASRTAFSFLENLLYAPNSAYVTYNNIIWVSPHGTGYELSSHAARDSIFPYRGKYNGTYMAQISLQSFANSVYGVMTGINRTEKYIIINNDAIIRYDYLILLCGKQYLMPVPSARRIANSKCSRNIRSRCSLFKYLINEKVDQIIEENVSPANIFLINSKIDATIVFINLQYLMRKRQNVKTEEKIIVYGQTLIVYLCIQSLLKFDIPPEMIVLVEPPFDDFGSEMVFSDPNVDAAVTDILRDLKITHYRDFELYDWTFCGNNQINTVIFHSKREKVTLKCLAMIPFQDKLVSDITFKAVNEASLVYDGKLIIDHKFQTNDPFIYAAGPSTKYRRMYHANEKDHELYDSGEVGKLLAEIIRASIDPTEEGGDSTFSQVDNVPVMENPILISGQLPGGWNYFHLKPPGKFVPLEVLCNSKEYGDNLITGDCQMTNGYGYFRLHLDKFGFVRTIICFTKDDIDIENLPLLYGKHEKYLNNLLVRFNLGHITDLFSYFRQPWVYAIYHDRFKDLMKVNGKLFESEDSITGQRIIDMVDGALKDSLWDEPPQDELNFIAEMFEISKIKEQITKNVVNYLKNFDEAFPMYATSGILRVLLYGANNSFLQKSITRDSSRVDFEPLIKISDFGSRF